MRPSQRPDRSAELIVENACVDYGAFYQRVAEDENGWDGMIEFLLDYEDIDSPAVKPNRFFIQIKSTIKRKPNCSIKLSNGVRSCKSDDPWFIILVQRYNDEINIFVKHYWNELISETMQMAWATKQDRRPFHRKRQSISFSSADKKDENFISFMVDQVNGIQGDYRTLKRDLVEITGYENGYGTGTFSLNIEVKIYYLKRCLGSRLRCR